MIEQSLCPICKNEDETIIHALCSYPATSDVWGRECKSSAEMDQQRCEFRPAVGKVVSVLQIGKLEETIVILRRTWLRMNKLQQYHEAITSKGDQLEREGSNGSNDVWRPPKEGMIKERNAGQKIARPTEIQSHVINNIACIPRFG